MPFQRRRKRVHPLRSRDEVFERFRRLDVVDAEWNDVDPLIDRPFHFPLDLRDALAFLEKIRIMIRLDSIALTIDSPQSAPGTTSRGATQQRTESAFEPRHDGVRHELVFDGVAYENIMSHKLNCAAQRRSRMLLS